MTNAVVTGTDTGPLIDQQLLVYFVAVAEELHFGRAATRCHVSQPALSKQIKRLERLVGLHLFDRGHGQVSLTEEGRRLLDSARDVLITAQHFVENSARERARKSGRLRVAFVAQAANEYTPLIMRAFSDLYPNVSVVLRQLGTSEVAEALRDGSADIAILRLPIDTNGLVVTPLFCEQRVVVLPADHPFAHHQTLSIGDLLDEPWIINATEDPAYQAFARGAAHRNPDRTITIGATIHTVGEYLEAVVARQGIGLAPESATRYYSHPGIVYVPVPDVEPSVAALAWPEQPDHTHPLAVALLDVAITQITNAPALPGCKLIAPRTR
jgi:DNA-binding transcriptional LysR family regulator